jgi:hypothetical protein
MNELELRDEARRAMTYLSKLELPGRTVSWRDVTEIVDADTQFFHNFVQLADGSELEVVTAKYVRRKS